MHLEAFTYVGRFQTLEPLTIVELGSRNTGDGFGSLRAWFSNATYIGVDAVAGIGVDQIGNAATWQPATPVDMVLACELFEHTPRWPEIIANTHTMLKSGGRAVFTCAGPGRAEHGIDHDDPDQPGYYRNIGPAELWAAMTAAGFIEVVDETAQHRSTRQRGTDTYATGIKAAR